MGKLLESIGIEVFPQIFRQTQPCQAPFLHPLRHLEERLQLFHQTHACSAVAGDIDAGQAAHTGKLRGFLEELVLVEE